MPAAIQFPQPARRLERRRIINDTTIRSSKPPAKGAVAILADDLLAILNAVVSRIFTSAAKQRLVPTNGESGHRREEAGQGSKPRARGSVDGS